MPCPHCKLGQAVHQKEAYAAFQSTHYARQRKLSRREKNIKPKPAVAKFLHIEGALLHPSFLNAVKPPPNASFDTFVDSKWFKWISYLVGAICAVISLIIINLLAEEGEDISRGSPARAAMGLLFITIYFFILWLIDVVARSREKKFPTDHSYWLKSWLCLRCGTRFYLERSNDGKPSIYLL